MICQITGYTIPDNDNKSELVRILDASIVIMKERGIKPAVQAGRLKQKAEEVME